jgi:hypothetical protein
MSTTTQIRINKSPKLTKQLSHLQSLYPSLEYSEIIKLALDNLARTTTPSYATQLLKAGAALWDTIDGDSPKFIRPKKRS